MRINTKPKFGHNLAKAVVIIGAIILLVTGTSLVWAVAIPIPDFDASLQEKKLSNSTKIYDRTGKILLYDVNGNIRRTVVPITAVSANMKKAILAAEDSNFYYHLGVQPSSILRAFFVNLNAGSVKQGGSTITQQVVKNLLLTNDKTITRKIKEAAMAIKIERSMTKDQIFELYLNIAPFGGNIYGVEEASLGYFGKSAKDLNLVESAYLAALPQAPTFFSPYGNNREKLEERKNFVIDQMFGLGWIKIEEAKSAKKQRLTFAPVENHGIKAPHFVFFIKQYLENKYGNERVENEGFRVITTLDWEFQQKAENIVKVYGDKNKVTFNAGNAALLAIDPKTGQILSMVGSRDYFDIENDGNYNITTAVRQPGSSFKPIVYAAAFNKGYTPETILFDVPTEFSVNCNSDGTPRGGLKASDCYMPENYDNKYEGPLKIRDALAQSRNIPAIKALYLAGINNSLDLAKQLGITTLKDKKRYGLTLVLGGGEVSLLDLTSVYSVFANDGVKNTQTGILRVEDKNGNILEEFKLNSSKVLPENTARQISSILSDNEARLPAYGANSPLYFPGRQVAVKTGTTNDFRDTWIIGYTPNLAVGVWSGNNNNTPMEKKVAGFIVAPMWNAYMNEILPKLPDERFVPPVTNQSITKPVLKGIWQGGEISNGVIKVDVHTILYWLNKDNPNGPIPTDPTSDDQFNNWEYAVKNWARNHGYSSFGAEISIPNSLISNTTSSQNNMIESVDITSPVSNNIYPYNSPIIVNLTISSKLPINRVDYFINDNLIGSTKTAPFGFVIKAEDLDNNKTNQILKVVVYDTPGNKKEQTVTFPLDI
ncbi:MAG: hypothetical protein A2556_01680 [Candidatus Vogelbacteria bacterium RIFOXYD2_FULL_44_9]|uniref:Uncharacterized protein n=1 Tax=Candidatus Vogelbacteria bacterium RIFOXYD2_FULL_44_9 TaxID=1802441 RepID=A0A1G2QIT9_9BACT|nr:MAG: hypothetical protein A2556_01680 [Candidatus Vogelbacteria bacterium RIFOXYD2_FULL_44_9]